jgi:leader peptidase (prepilin peptidase)/N-methyltransferase
MGIAFLCLIPYVFLLLMITVTDWEQRLIFDDTTRPLAVLGLAQTIFVSYAAASYTPLLENLLAAVFGGFAFLILAYLTQGGVGGGDVKLIAALGLWLGPDRLLTVVCAGLFLGGLAALWLLLTRQKKRKDSFAYGPCFTIPAILSLLV